ncbi:7,8-didemethyl-8-hydroxy-5-deazariboflavin synthase subunit CofH [Methanoplanus sp. FWC-SCC4]|uniref:5-amino-6-(D-ribitylamino)uracil--L-tyrosine 4-hydroxyphenyl transferase n=1 Tax=Methanochimaera problematica TaxID=2609417 RepID=A0AA97I3N2_9EURY|nr:5-amino-6-(D-ribitylamino)uracil--L-tyrosine 4-hydroxyphenyl transferase CofH [Methanoplanus sp. FWC-SCC4]WOF16888.1 7,8-didemethyl-8-hydroxy-5-deazariboflavin synthase subunit CofH [Methanoplanus sp. FWC-SCC4]
MTDRTDTLLKDVLEGYRMKPEEAVFLLKTKDRKVWDIAKAADMMREKKAGNSVTYVRNQNIHVTNICKNLCAFCGFGKPKNDPEAYIYSDDQFRKSAEIAKERNVTEICFLSGVHPDFDAERYCEIIRMVRDIVPDADIHTMSPDEISYAAKKSDITSEEVIRMIKDAGLGTLQGTAAEMLVDDVRKIICPSKVSTSEWIRIIKEAHNMGIKSTSTIMYGSVETEEDRIKHLSILRDIQDETNGFTELVPLSFLHMNTKLYQKGLAPAGATGRTDILLFAVSRLFLDNFDNIQIPWGKVGKKFTQLGLLAGGNDLGGTMFCDAVSTEAGGEDSDFFDPGEMERIVKDIGRELRQRTTKYELI